MRARMALLVSGQACEIREVALRDKPRAMLAASPKATVPVLVLPDGTVIDESLDIMRWALERADPEGWLQGEDAALIAQNDRTFKDHLDRYKYPNRYGLDPLEHRAGGLKILAEINARLSVSAYLCGGTRMFTDTALMPFIRQFAAVDCAWFNAQPLTHVQFWLATHESSPLFAAAMVRFTTWRDGDKATLFN